MQRRRRYAERTSVPVGKSKADLETLLRKSGASQTLTGTDSNACALVLGFTLEGRQFRIKVLTGPALTSATKAQQDKQEQRERQAWRTLLLLVKAKLEVVAMGQSTIESEFLANVVLPNGKTVADDVLPKLLKAYESGKMPNLLPMGEP